MKNRLGGESGSAAYSVEEVARLLGIGRAKAYEMVREGRIPAIHFGRRICVPRVALERMLSEEMQRA